MRILVTGGAGFVGSHTVDALAASGADEVSVLDNLSSGKRHQVNDKATFYQVDLRDAHAVKTVIEKAKPEVIVHLAAQMDDQTFGRLQAQEQPVQQFPAFFRRLLGRLAGVIFQVIEDRLLIFAEI